jgi:hypothetical protein
MYYDLATDNNNNNTEVVEFLAGNITTLTLKNVNNSEKSNNSENDNNNESIIDYSNFSVDFVENNRGGGDVIVNMFKMQKIE